MSPNTKAMLKSAILPVIAVGFVGWAIISVIEAKKDAPIQVLQCVDTASQETVFSQDYILSAKTDYDLWKLELEEGWVHYVQPSGVVCTLRESLMAVENAKGKVS